MGRLEKIDVEGEILPWVGSEPGFYYKPGQVMHIWVKMVTTITYTNLHRKKFIYERFRVAIPPNAMQQPEKAQPNGTFQAFTNAAFLVKKPANTNLDWKLWALGEEVRVTNYETRTRFGNWAPAFPPQRYKSIFAKDDQACFDMLFVNDPDDPNTLPGGRLPAGSGPPYYCLGRCNNPPIVNTL